MKKKQAHKCREQMGGVAGVGGVRVERERGCRVEKGCGEGVMKQVKGSNGTNFQVKKKINPGHIMYMATTVYNI